jgi:hypothetical protein
MLRCAVIGSRWSSDLPRDGTECLQEACHPVLSRSLDLRRVSSRTGGFFVRPPSQLSSPDQQAAVTAAGAGHIAKRIAMLNQIISYLVI